MSMHMLTVLGVKNGSISVFTAFSKQYLEEEKKEKKSETFLCLAVEATTEFALNHCTTVTWV